MTELANGLRTYRPVFDSYVFSSPEIQAQVNTWIAGVKDGSVSRALLITGDSGLGKTTLGLAACMQLGANASDIQEENCASARTLEDARALIRTLDISPAKGDYRVLLLDECHKMVANAWDAFLTPIENMSRTTLLVGCTSKPNLLSPEFKRRFYEIKLGEYSEDSLIEILSNLPQKLKPATMVTIATLANGNPGRAIKLAESNVVGGDVDQGKALAEELVVIENFVAALFENNVQKLFLYSRMVKEDTRTAFFERVLQFLEAGWLTCYDLTSTMSVKDVAFIKAQVGRLNYQSKAIEPEAQVAEIKKLRARYIGRLHKEFAALTDKPLLFLRSWAMGLGQ
jgi:DNA polymerase III delta prime subunit